MGKVCILGLGGWGTAIAVPLTDAGSEVVVWGRRSEAVESFNRTGCNERYLPGIQLKGVRATVDLLDALRGAEVVVVAVPSLAAREVCRRAAEVLASSPGRSRPTVLSTCKGLEPGTRKRISSVVAEEMGSLIKGVAVVSGPNFATEVARRLPTATVVASAEIEIASDIRDRLMTPSFRVYVNLDVTGVEIAGALKNVIAIAVGISDGLGLGYNARAALITRGLAEMARLGEALGANKLTFSGLAGLGDLVLTCTGEYSRNRRAGQAIARGQTLEEFVRSTGALVEGAQTTREAVALADSLGVQMPVAREVYQILFEGKPPADVVWDIMTREKKTE